MSEFKFNSYTFINYFALASALSGCAYVANNFITHVYDMPGLFGFLDLIGVTQFYEKSSYEGLAIAIGFFQSYLLCSDFFPAILKNMSEASEIISY